MPFAVIYPNLAALLDTAFSEAQIVKTRVAHALNVDVQTIYRWLRGNHAPAKDAWSTLANYCATAGLTVDKIKESHDKDVYNGAPAARDKLHSSAVGQGRPPKHKEKEDIPAPARLDDMKQVFSLIGEYEQRIFNEKKAQECLDLAQEQLSMATKERKEVEEKLLALNVRLPSLAVTVPMLQSATLFLEHKNPTPPKSASVPPTEAPYGYKIGEHGLLPKFEEQAVIVEARTLFAEGTKLDGISKTLAANGMFNRRGIAFTPDQIAGMLVPRKEENRS